MDVNKERRSIRKFQNTEVLEETVEAGLCAASGKGLQSPVILAVTDPEAKPGKEGLAFCL